MLAKHCVTYQGNLNDGNFESIVQMYLKPFLLFNGTLRVKNSQYLANTHWL